MNRIKKVLLGLALAFVCVITLASCSKISQSYADKINNAAEKKEYVTVADAKDALGDEGFDITIAGTGALLAVKGYKNNITWAELDAKLDALDKDTKIEAIIIGCVLNNCVSAAYISGTAAEVEAKLAELSK
jgi:hypothetical protein